MRAVEMLQERLRPEAEFVHAKRWSALWRVVGALIAGEQLWLTALGRSLPSAAQPKHAIKAVDRLLGNQHLARERDGIAAALVGCLARKRSRPIILVDTVELRHRCVALTAALAFDGRALPIYSTVVRHVKVKVAEFRRFLDGLSKVLPPGSRPILLTDAGFETPWLRELDERGWDYITRVRGQVFALIDGEWQPLTHLRARATRRAKNLGYVLMPKKEPYRRRLVLSRTPKCKHRQISTRRGPARDTNYQAYRKNAHEPMILSTSLRCAPQQVVSLYQLRMQIEQTFRDLKNHRWGWSMRHCRSRSLIRVELLLLVASIAMVAQHLVGIAGESLRLEVQHQANTIRDRRVLSTFFLGGLLLQRVTLIDDRHLKAAHQHVRRRIETLHGSA